MKMYVVFLLLTTATLVSPQQPPEEPTPTVPASVLWDVFGSDVGQFGQTIAPQQYTTVKPAETSVIINNNTDSCTCVPYYLCDINNVGVDINNASVTGYGVLDVRYGESKCGTLENCCTNPKKPEDVPPAVPDAKNLKGCGYRNPNGIDFTITGGTGSEAQFGEFPWVVALKDALNDKYTGVGVLIHPQVVLTGAHVADKYGPGKMVAIAGEWDMETSKERLPHQKRFVQDMILHEGFRKKILYNDVALLKVDQPFQLTDHINVICLPRQEENFDSSRNCVANGWGKDVFGIKGHYAQLLKKVEQNMIPHDRCQNLLRRSRLGSSFQLHNTFVCAGGEETKDTCTGDGGAPLVCPIGNGRYKLSGLVAWGIGCGKKDVPAVYAAVSKFRNWIDQKMESWGYDTSLYNID